MPALPVALGVLFALTTALTVGLFYRAAHRSGRVLALLLGWLTLQGALALTGFYTVLNSWPPRPGLLLLPPLLVIGGLLLTVSGRRWLAGLQPRWLTLLHVVRVPVELVLLGLFHAGLVPRLMTFEGRNWDILAGLSAPLVYYLVFRRRRGGRRLLLIWNCLALGLLLNIVVNALLALPAPWQQWGFEQPNVAILHFPFGWLPAVVVPLVLLAHVAALWQLRPAAKTASDAATSAPARLVNG